MTSAPPASRDPHAAAAPSASASTSARRYPSAANRCSAREAQTLRRAGDDGDARHQRATFAATAELAGDAWATAADAGALAESARNRFRVRVIWSFQNARTMSMRLSGVVRGAEHVGQRRRQPLLEVEHVHDHLGLVAVDGELRPAGRDQPDEVEPRRTTRREDGTGHPERDRPLAADQLVRAGTAGRPGNRSPRRWCRPRAGRRRRTRRSGSIEPPQPGRRDDPAVLDPVQHEAVHHRAVGR